jgi:hypothetical protein
MGSEYCKGRIGRGEEKKIEWERIGIGEEKERKEEYSIIYNNSICII